GVGAGSDFYNWVNNGALAVGIDLTQSAIDLTEERLEINEIQPERYQVRVADAEMLTFDQEQFDIVYSWGVLHHTPNTVAAFNQTFRVLKHGGTLKAMIYHIPSWTGYMLWIRYALLRGRPFSSVKKTVFHHLVSTGTKVYT